VKEEKWGRNIIITIVIIVIVNVVAIVVSQWFADRCWSGSQVNAILYVYYHS
jgi:hypothetical protein